MKGPEEPSRNSQQSGYSNVVTEWHPAMYGKHLTSFHRAQTGQTADLGTQLSGRALSVLLVAPSKTEEDGNREKKREIGVKCIQNTSKM